MRVRVRAALPVCLALALGLAAPALAEPGLLAVGEPLPEAPHVSSEPPVDDELLLEDDWLEEEAPDPLEPGNRVVFGANDVIYRWVLDPVADVYEFVVPSPVRRSVRRFFANLREPANLVNELIQLRACDAGKSGARFLINSTVGVAGLFDPAKAWGLEPYHTDFGQTLAYYGVGDGAYIVLPLVGPANLRDAFGQLVDATMRPDIWLLAAEPQLLFVTSDGLTGYESRRIYLDELRESSFDFYAAVRSAYRMDRDAQIRELRANAGRNGRGIAADPEPAEGPDAEEGLEVDEPLEADADLDPEPAPGADADAQTGAELEAVPAAPDDERLAAPSL